MSAEEMLDRLIAPESVAYLSPSHARACRWAVEEIKRLRAVLYPEPAAPQSINERQLAQALRAFKQDPTPRLATAIAQLNKAIRKEGARS
jgi:hypothetical protein